LWETFLALALQQPGAAVAVGARRMDEFEGSSADTSSDPPAFVGLATASGAWGPVAAGFVLQRAAEPSPTSHYQVMSRAAVGASVAMGDDARFSLALRTETADRSMGADMSMWVVTAGFENSLNDSWTVCAELQRQTRKADLPETEYDVTSFAVGFTWHERLGSIQPDTRP
jgi:hypothetical protein